MSVIGLYYPGWQYLVVLDITIADIGSITGRLGNLRARTGVADTAIFKNGEQYGNIYPIE